MTKVHHLNCVEIQSPFGSRAIGHCLLIETTEKLILIDTGIGLLDTQNPAERIGEQLIEIVGYRFDENCTALRQVERLGLNPEKVTDCVISHLDNDHIGGLADFPNATVHVGIEEYENFKSDNPRYLKTPLSHNPQIITYGQSENNWFGFEARHVDIDTEGQIFFIPLFGHTSGHCGIAIKVNDKWLLYVADAYYLKAELTDENHPVSELAKLRADNNELRIQTLHKIRKFVNENPKIEIFSYHDPKEFINYKMLE
ncbi:MBL fold metallo-hydrolase [Cyclobacterium marinum]|uniref:MBL fold metallo-hydrolase n=1 Tax=Cyclobacterium marinum TaxID=104 RepID=UPI0030DC6ED9|tara:strand:+ start:887 stop:1654 length:768 start_codon:yes stop_codon:yes gene_type:complete